MDNLDCVPKSGLLIIRYKSGSIQPKISPKKENSHLCKQVSDSERTRSLAERMPQCSV